jgi:formylglycine-generating enzyme required for sulfatase activity
VGDFKKFVSDSGYKIMAEIFGKAWWYDAKKNEIIFKIGASWKDTGFVQTANQPVVNVSWYDALKYCIWKSKLI